MVWGKHERQREPSARVKGDRTRIEGPRLKCCAVTEAGCPRLTWRGCPSVSRYRPQANCGNAMAASDSRSAKAAAHCSAFSRHCAASCNGRGATAASSRGQQRDRREPRELRLCMAGAPTGQAVFLATIPVHRRTPTQSTPAGRHNGWTHLPASQARQAPQVGQGNAGRRRLRTVIILLHAQQDAGIALLQ